MSVPASRTTLDFTGDLTIRTSEAQLKRLREAITCDGDVVVDCRGAAEVDVTFLQLLLAAQHALGAVGRRVLLKGPLDGGLLDAMHRAGLLSDAFEVTNV